MTTSAEQSIRRTLEESVSTAEGHLATLEETQTDTLDFAWEGINFTASSQKSDTGGAIIHLEANIGRLYYSVEDAAQRAMAVERIFSTNRGIDGTYRLSHKGDVSFESVTATDLQMKGADLMGAVTLILLEAETHLRALRSHLKPPQAA